MKNLFFALTVFVLFQGFLLGQVKLDSGLVAYYPFNGNAIDESGNGNDGTVNGAILTEDRFGIENSAYRFSGDDNIEIMDSDTLDISSAITICAWINTNTIMETYQSILCKDGADHSVSYELYIREYYHIAFYAGGAVHVCDTLQISKDNWYFLVTQYTGTQINHFINSNLVYSEPDENDLPVTDNSIKIGDDAFAHHYFHGIIDDIRLYNRALSNDEIYALYIESGWPSVIEEDISGISAKFELYQNFPNPFNPATMITYQLPSYSNVQLIIYNIFGQKIRTLVNENQSAGFHQFLWDGRNNIGQDVSSGIYLYKLQTPEFAKTKRLLLLR